MNLDLIGVPYTSAAKPGGIADAIGVLRGAGLVASVSARDVGDLELPQGSGVRGPSRLLNEEALGHLVSASREVVADSLERGRLPLLVGGDCPALLGPLAAVGERAGDVGLLLVDGHEDGWPPRLSTTGEASDSEVGIALGRVEGLPEPLAELLPLLTPERVAMLGPRDRRELDEAGVESLDGTVALFRDDEAVRAHGAAASAREAVGLLGGSFWLHVDLDVLRTEDFPAADYLQPGGLGWEELLEVAATAIAQPGCRGCSVVIYNPDLDPTRATAKRVVRFIADLAAG